jgi:lysine 2,3-aminomutase
MPTSLNWKSEFSAAFRNLEELSAFLELKLPASLTEVAKTYPVFIPRRLAGRIKAAGLESALAREFLPAEAEVDPRWQAVGFEDPIGDKTHQVAPQLIHRYPSRVLFTVTNLCPVHCRYCFRKNELSSDDELFVKNFEQTLAYLKTHDEISEIIFTGGDPFTLSTEKLKSSLMAFAEISHIRHIRFHSRYPVIMPERFDDELIALLKESCEKFETVSLAIHANIVDEFDEIALGAVGKLNELPLQLLSQTVLLKGINDSASALLDLMNLFIRLKVRPYYLHHPDQVKGGMHFYLPLSDGRSLYTSLRAKLPGWAIPHYVIDVPGGAGKVPAFNPEGHAYSGKILSLEGELLLRAEPIL